MLLQNEKQIEKQIKEYLDNLRSPNIAVIGLAGVGKSSLINAVFGVEIAETGAGRSVTLDYKKYSPDKCNIPVTLYDSPGYEAGGDAMTFVRKTFRFLDEQRRKGPEEQIHLIWYVINAASARIQEFDINILNKINTDNIPAIIILSQCDRASQEEINSLKLAIEDINFTKVYDILEVSASPLKVQNKLICEPFGLELLVRKTIDLLPNIYSDAVILAQITDIESKRELAWRHIAEASFGCFGTGALPIPLSSLAGALGGLGYLYSKIFAIYGHNSRRELLLGITGLTTGGLITLVVDSFFDSLSLVLPGISILTGAVAAGYVTASGIAFAKTCERFSINRISGSKEDVIKVLRDTFTEEFNNIKNIKIQSAKDITNLGKRFINHEI